MTTIDFYLLTATDQKQCWLVAARLAEKAYEHQQITFILTESAKITQELDNLLWTFKEDTFLPHAIANTNTQAPILLGDTITSEPQIVINLTTQIPVLPNSTQRLIEVVSGDASDKAQARERYRHYRTQGYELKTHEIK